MMVAANEDWRIATRPGPEVSVASPRLQRSETVRTAARKVLDGMGVGGGVVNRT